MSIKDEGGEPTFIRTNQTSRPILASMTVLKPPWTVYKLVHTLPSSETLNLYLMFYLLPMMFNVQHWRPIRFEPSQTGSTVRAQNETQRLPSQGLRTCFLSLTSSHFGSFRASRKYQKGALKRGFPYCPSKGIGCFQNGLKLNFSSKWEHETRPNLVAIWSHLVSF